MELRALRYFVTVAEELHFGRAAERLHVVQPAVSQQIARLERELGTLLLDRSPRRVRLTAAGERVLEAARAALTAADQVRLAAGAQRTTLRIGTAPALTARLERAIDVLRADDPTVEAVLVDLPPGARLDAVRDGRLDVALTRGTVAAAGLTVLAAWSEPLHAVVATNHQLADRPTVTLAELTPGPFRMLDDDADPPVYDVVTRVLRDAGVCPVRGRTAGSVQDLVVAVGSDPGAWTLLPAEQVVASGSRRVRGLPLDPPLAVIGNVVAPASMPAGCVRALADAFADECRRVPAAS